jgi:hypothetical protein
MICSIITFAFENTTWVYQPLFLSCIEPPSLEEREVGISGPVSHGSGQLVRGAGFGHEIMRAKLRGLSAEPW